MQPNPLHRFAPVLLLLLMLAPAKAAEWYEARGARPPAGNRVYVCHGYGCRMVTPVQLSAGEIGRIAAPLKRRKADAAAEREAVSDAVQAFEKLIGARVGTGDDLARTQIGRRKVDQLDCIDEATNTTSLLRLLAEQGLLAHHTVLQPVARGFFLDGRYPHATAVLAEEGGGKWAIDSWPTANGEAPIIQPLPEWYSSR